MEFQDVGRSGLRTTEGDANLQVLVSIVVDFLVDLDRVELETSRQGGMSKFVGEEAPYDVTDVFPARERQDV